MIYVQFFLFFDNWLIYSKNKKGFVNRKGASISLVSSKRKKVIRRGIEKENYELLNRYVLPRTYLYFEDMYLEKEKAGR